MTDVTYYLLHRQIQVHICMTCAVGNQPPSCLIAKYSYSTYVRVQQHKCNNFQFMESHVSVPANLINQSQNVVLYSILNIYTL